MIMNQEDIDKKLRDSKAGDKTVLDVRLSDLRKGIRLARSCRDIVFTVHRTIRIELEIDPHDASSHDDKYTLFSTDKARTYRRGLSVKDDRVDGDNKITLEYDGIHENLNYSLEIGLGEGNRRYLLFEDMPYSSLA